MTLRGNIEAVDNGVLNGWYYAEDGSREFRVFADGSLLGVGVADRFRDDLLADGIGDGAHAFAFPLPSRLCDGAEHQFAIAHGIVDEQAAARALKTVGGANGVVGRVERVGEGEARGWTWDRSDPTARLEVSAIENGRVVASTIANLHRDDLAAEGFGDGRRGFAMKLPLELFRRPEPVELTFRVDDAHGGAVLAVVRTAARPGGEAEAGALSEPTAAARAGMREISDPLFLQARFRSDLDAVSFALAASGVAVTTQAPRGFVRLLHRFPGIGFIVRGDWSIEIEFETAASASVCVAIVDFNLAERFEPIVPLADEVMLPPGRHRLAYSLLARRVRARSPDISERPIFLSLETRAALDLRHLSVRIEPREAPAESVPLRAADHPHFAQLADLNDALASVGKRDPDAWALETAEAAIRMECFETASGLIDRIAIAGRNPEFQRRYLRAFVEVAFAQDRLEDIRASLREHWPLTEKDDWLFSAYSACLPAAPEDRSSFATLPSGRANRFWLARYPRNSETFSVCQRDDYEDGQGDLLWANLARPFGAREYLAGWNRYLRRFRLEGLRSIDLTHRNALSTVTFEPSPPVDDGPLVSVLMSAYNSSDTVLYAVQSVLRQSYGNFELLICDDLSADDTFAKLQRLRGNPRIRLFRSRNNQGPYNIRNNLIRAARGRFVTFQDADDVAHPARLARQVAELQRTGRPFTIARWVRVRPDGEVVFFRDQRCLRLSLVSQFAEVGAIERFEGFRQVLCGGDSEFAQRIRGPGVEKIYSEMDQPLIFGLWSAQSLTQQQGLEASENGVRSKSRRVYAEAAARRNLLGEDLVPNEAVDEANRSVAIYRPDCGIVSLDD